MLHVRAFDLFPKNPEQMSESNTPNASELARLRALVSDYEAKMTYSEAWVARVRHEINNSLAAVFGPAQLWLREELNDKPRARVETIEKLVMRIKEIVGELRDIPDPAIAVNDT